MEGIGSLKLTKNLNLSVVLYNSKLDCNLIAISKLTHDLNCVTKFFLNLYEFQAVESGKVIGNAKLCGGIYLLKDNTPFCRPVPLPSNVSEGFTNSFHFISNSKSNFVSMSVETQVIL